MLFASRHRIVTFSSLHFPRLHSGTVALPAPCVCKQTPPSSLLSSLFVHSSSVSVSKTFLPNLRQNSCFGSPKNQQKKQNFIEIGNAQSTEAALVWIVDPSVGHRPTSAQRRAARWAAVTVHVALSLSVLCLHC